MLKETVDNDRLTVYPDGLEDSVSGAYLSTEGEESYKTWEGRRKYNAALCDDIWMLGSPKDRLNAKPCFMSWKTAIWWKRRMLQDIF